MITDHDVAEYVLDPDHLNMRWFYVARYFDDEEASKAAYEGINDYAHELGGEAQIAGYRMLDGHPNAGGKTLVVVVLGSKEERVRTAAPMLGGLPYALSDEMIRMLVLRRLRFMLAANTLGAEKGHYAFQHDGGLRLDSEGRPRPTEDET